MSEYEEREQGQQRAAAAPQITYVPPLPVPDQAAIQLELQQRALQRYQQFFDIQAVAQRSSAAPVLEAAQVQRSFALQRQQSQLALQRQIEALSEGLPPDVLQAALQRQAEQAGVPALPPVFSGPTRSQPSYADHAQRYAHEAVALQRQADQHSGFVSMSAWPNIQQRAAQDLVQRFRQDTSPAMQRYAELGQSLALVQRQPQGKQVARVVLQRLPAGERPMVQRALDEAEQEHQQFQAQDQKALERHTLQRKLTEEDALAPQAMPRGNGQALPLAVQRRLAVGLNIPGEHLQSVRVHVDSSAHSFAKSVQAIAATVGTHIFFQQGKLDTESAEGQELLAHEVTHTWQQSQGKVQGGGIDPDPGLEQEARDAGKTFARQARTPEFLARFERKRQSVEARFQAGLHTPETVQRLAEPQASDLKRGEAWERSFTGSKGGVTFHLKLYRYPDGRLAGTYHVEGGSGQRWHLSGSVREDGRFKLWGDQNSAVFEGRYGSDNQLYVDDFHLGNGQSYRVQGLDLRPVELSGAGPAQTATSKTPLIKGADDRATQPKADGQAWGERKHFSCMDDQETRFELDLDRDERGLLTGGYRVNGGQDWGLRGVLYADGHFEVRAQNGASFQGQAEQSGGQLTLRAHFEHDKTGYKGEVRLEQTAAPKRERRALPDSKTLQTGLKNGQPQAERSSWEDTITSEQRAKLPALQEAHFLEALSAMCGRLGVPRDELLAVMTFESADWRRGTLGLDPKADNGSHAGLIQFGQDFTKGVRSYGVEDYRDFTNLSAIQQLKFVELYLEKHGVREAVELARKENRQISLEELYLSVLGGNARKGRQPVWAESGNANYLSNAHLDNNRDQQITPTEAADAVRLHWRDVYGNNLDERSTHIEREYYTQNGKQRWRVKDHGEEVFSSLLNIDPSLQQQVALKENQTEQESPKSGRLKSLTRKEFTAINAQGMKARGQEIGSLDGVVGYFNANDGGHDSDRWYSKPKADGSKYYYGLRWQCVEYIRRYYYDVLGHEIHALGNAMNYFDRGLSEGAMNSERGLVQYKNGGEEKPQYRDIIVWGPNPASKVGHVGIVASVSENELVIAQQNAGRFSRSVSLKKATEKGKTYWRLYGGPVDDAILGWLRSK